MLICTPSAEVALDRHYFRRRTFSTVMSKSIQFIPNVYKPCQPVCFGGSIAVGFIRPLARTKPELFGSCMQPCRIAQTLRQRDDGTCKEWI